MKISKKTFIFAMEYNLFKFMQLSFFDNIPSKVFYLDVYAEAFCDSKSKKMKLKTITGQQVPDSLKISVPNRYLSKFPEGTIVKVDTRLIEKRGKRPYFIALKKRPVQRAIEFFEYNLKLQYGFNFKLSK